jgi:hypothetical protein
MDDARKLFGSSGQGFARPISTLDCREPQRIGDAVVMTGYCSGLGSPAPRRTA